MTGAEQVLIEDWCQQYPSHSIGSLAFGADGALYVSGGDGASFNFADYGQDGSPLNPCGDPPGGVGATLTPPTAEGGALRSQDLRTTGDPATPRRRGPARRPGDRRRRCRTTRSRSAPTRTRAGSSPTACATRSGSPIRPGHRARSGSATSAGTTGRRSTASSHPTDAAVDNFGWPCYEGAGRQGGYDGANLSICENLYAPATGAVAAPYFAYNHSAKVVPGETCPTGSSSIAGARVLPRAATTRPSYDGALFFADYSRDCIWVMPTGANGLPDPASDRDVRRRRRRTRSTSQIGPGGDLFYVDFDGGTIRRITLRRARTSRRSPSRPATPTTRRRAADRRVRRHAARATRTPATRSPTPGTSTATARSTTRPPRTADVHLHAAGHLHRPACASPTRTARPTPTSVTITAGNTPPDRDDRRAGRRHDLEGRRRRSPSPARATDAAGGHAPARRRSRWSLDPAPLPVELPRAPAADVRRASPAARSSPRTTSTRRTSSCA